MYPPHDVLICKRRQHTVPTLFEELTGHVASALTSMPDWDAIGTHGTAAPYQHG